LSWKITARAPRAQVERALIAHEDAEHWPADAVLSGSEIEDSESGEWRLEAWFAGKPGKAEKKAIAALFDGQAPDLAVEKLPVADWVTLSQQAVEPIRAGRFHVHTPDYPPLGDVAVTDFCIPASQAFGTGQHATTAGCLAMLTQMRARGVVARNIADIGTGTGLLAFAALDLWPRALATASDIDAVCAGVVEENCALNGLAQGAGAGELAMVIAPGMDDPLLRARGPYDLLIANILAGPLIELAPDFARAVLPGGHVLLAGLLAEQEAAVRRAYRFAGFRLAARLQRGEWPVLWLRKRSGGRARASRPSAMPEWSQRW
jgi:ribosomal protein L11 methyltransferase